MVDPLPPSKALPYLISLVSSIAGALVMYWSIADRMEKQITDKVNLVSRVAQLGERVDGLKSDLNNVRTELSTLRTQTTTTTHTTRPTP
jgi:uncharacterized membrane protein